MANIEQFPFISVSGSPHERGLQYGRQAAGRVRGSARLYGQTLVNLGYGDQARARLIDHFAKEIGNFAPHYIDEMRGIAEGSGVDFQDIVMINARTEVLAKARAEKVTQADQEPGDGCTGALILPERSANGNLLHGQNWDWRAECVETSIVLRVRSR
jgi:isopenicillin-N N-acyltransferase-like protein